MAAPDVQREGENEARLRQARLASSRASDAAAEENRERLAGARPSDEAARQNLARFSGNPGDDRVGATSWRPPPPVAPRPDAARGGMIEESARAANLDLARRQDRGAEAPQGGGGPSLREAAMIAKATPAGMAAGAATGLLTGQGLQTSQVQKMIGRGCVRQWWLWLWPSLGHTIYFLAIVFYIAWASKFARRYLPQIGEEWFPPEFVEKVPKAVLIPIKLGELVAMMFLLLFVFMFDMLCIGVLAFVLALILSVT
jgi:hypothetical protein